MAPTRLRILLLVMLCSLGACAERGLSRAAPGNGDLAAPPDRPVDLAMAPPDLASLPQTITFEINLWTGRDVSGDLNQVWVPLPTPTTVPVDGIVYVYSGFHAGQYEYELAWQDTSNGNLGWTASFGGAPGVTNGWPITHRILTMSDSSTEFGPDKVALVAGRDAQPNTLIISVRRVDAPNSDYGVLYQKVAGK